MYKLTFILFLFSVLICWSCQTTESIETTSTFVKGRLESKHSNSVLFYTDTLFKIVPISQDATFSIDLPNHSKDQFWGIAAGFNRGYFYLNSVDSITLNLEENDFLESLTDNLKDPTNQYLLQKQQQLKTIAYQAIDSIEIESYLDSLEEALTKSFESFQAINQVSSNFKATEKINILTEISSVDYTHKLISRRKTSLQKNIPFEEEWMIAPRYLDFLDQIRWGLGEDRIKATGNSPQSMNIHELTSFQVEGILQLLAEKPLLKSYLLLRALRTQISAGGIDKISSNLTQFLSNNVVTNYMVGINEMLEERKQLTKGAPAPNFKYENEKGEKVELAQLKGKYIFIDIWATWCKPCIEEMPHLKKMEQKFSEKNIQFIAISIDDNKADWLSFLEKNTTTGIQLFGDNGEQSSIMKDYKIRNLPNYILIDPEGNIVDLSAPKPSSENLEKLFSKLL